MPDHEKRISMLENQVDTHLRESGEVREAIKDLHKSVDKIDSRIWAFMLSSIGVLVCIVGFLLKVSLWR